MLVVRDLASAAQISNPEIRHLVEQRINDLGGEAFDASELGYFLIVEGGDTVDTLAAQLGFSMLANRFTGIRYDQAGFTPSIEFVEEFAGCFDMVFIISDDGFGVEVFIPKTEGVDPDLLALCTRFATTPFPDSGPP